jgi:hypothetical protein
MVARACAAGWQPGPMLNPSTDQHAAGRGCAWRTSRVAPAGHVARGRMRAYHKGVKIPLMLVTVRSVLCQRRNDRERVQPGG